MSLATVAATRVAATESIRKRVTLRRRLAIQVLGGKCAECDETRNLHFDHIDPRTKKILISRAIRISGEVAFWTEVLKCQLLCKSHHAEKTSRDHVAGRTRIGKPRFFTPKQAREVAKRYEQGDGTLITLAAEYGCAPSTVWHAVHNAR